MQNTAEMDMEATLRGNLARHQQALSAMYAGEAEDYCFPPLFILEGPGLKPSIVPIVDSLADLSKEQVTAIVRLMADTTGADFCTHTSEGWSIPPQSAHTYVAGETIADRPDRIEVLSLVLTHRSGAGISCYARIVRAQGKVTLDWQPVLYRAPGGTNFSHRMDVFGSLEKHNQLQQKFLDEAIKTLN